MIYRHIQTTDNGVIYSVVHSQEIVDDLESQENFFFIDGKGLDDIPDDELLGGTYIAGVYTPAIIEPLSAEKLLHQELQFDLGKVEMELHNIWQKEMWESFLAQGGNQQLSNYTGTIHSTETAPSKSKEELFKRRNEITAKLAKLHEIV